MENQSCQNIVYPMLRKLRGDLGLKQIQVVEALKQWDVSLNESALSKIAFQIWQRITISDSISTPILLRRPK